MAEKDQSPYPLAPANAYGRSDEESALTEEELKRKKRMKLITYVVAFIVFQTIVITIFGLTVMKVNGPKFRVRAASFDGFNVGTTASPSFGFTMNTQFGVKNPNFGEYKFQPGTVTFAYRGTTVGEATIVKAKANMKSTKKVNATVTLTSSGLTSTSELASDISSGIIPLSSSSKLNGKVTLMFIMKKKKSAQMNCTMEVNIASQSLQNIVCK